MSSRETHLSNLHLNVAQICAYIQPRAAGASITAGGVQITHLAVVRSKKSLFTSRKGQPGIGAN